MGREPTSLRRRRTDAVKEDDFGPAITYNEWVEANKYDQEERRYKTSD
jgi:hypothetical protein